jgi:hypothetical protein
MSIDITSVLKQIDDVLQTYEAKRSPTNTLEVNTLIDATIDRLAPPRSRYRENAHALITHYGINNLDMEDLVGILKALRSDYAAGRMQTVQELIHANMFEDFLEMAEYLLSEGYEHAAAVMVGGVLEEHLRKLCEKNTINLLAPNGKPKRAETMNEELAGKDVYNKLQQKYVTAWLDLRNNAAHGHYDKYVKEDVEKLLESVRDFAKQFSA